MHCHTELSFVDEFQWVGITPSPLKKWMTERFSSVVHVASGAANFTPTTVLSC
jgi:hypothetical protein